MIPRAAVATGAVLWTLFAFAASARAEDGWTVLPPPRGAAPALTNPLSGLYAWYGKAAVPVSPPAIDRYFRVSWADLEPNDGRFDFAILDKALAAAGPTGRIAFGVMPLDTCCSHRNGLDVPADLPSKLPRGFWAKADPGRPGLTQVYVPDWNDPVFIARFTRLFQALGKRYDGDPRIAWIDLRGYGNWGEGHLAGAHAYPDGRLPYADPAVNKHGAQPGTVASRIALIDAIARAFPHTRLVAMTDDKPALLHALSLKTAIPIGMRRDSWGAVMFARNLLTPDLAPAERALIENRWKIAPFVVESYGGAKAFEAGADGIVDQVDRLHVSAIGNGNFGGDWPRLTDRQRQALLSAAVRAGYHMVPVRVAYRRGGACTGGVTVAITWENRGVAPTYEPWSVRLRQGSGRAATAPLPPLLPGSAESTAACVPNGTTGGAPPHLRLSVVSPTLPARTMALDIAGNDGDNEYDLGALSP